MHRFLVAVLLALALPLAAQNKQAPAVPKYDPAAEEKMQAVVESYVEYDCKISGATGGHLKVKLGEEVLEVHLAPAKYLKEYNMTFNAGDKLKITGVKVEWNGGTAILPREIERGNDMYYFRDARGKPLW